MTVATNMPCPICESDQTTPQRTYTAEQAAAHFCPPTRNADRYERLRDATARLWTGKDAQSMECRNCGHGFIDPLISGDETYYTIMHEQAGYPGWRWEYDWTLKHMPTKGKWLDVGAGDGAFLRKLPAGWNGYAIESTELMRNKLKSAGITVFNSNDEARQQAAGQMDVISMFQVLEHVDDAIGMLSNLKPLLNDGGQLVISVPDGQTNDMQEQLTGCLDMPPNHVHRFTTKSLNLALERAGLNVAATGKEPDNWKIFKFRVQLKTVAQSQQKGTLAAWVTGIKQPKVRRAALLVPATLNAFRMLPRRAEGRIGRTIVGSGVKR